jgi:hypothetical protein
MLDPLIRECRYHHFRAGHLRHGLLRFLSCSHRPFAKGRQEGISEIKKGLKSPLFRAPPHLAGGHPPPAVRLDTRISDVTTKVRTGRAFLS